MLARLALTPLFMTILLFSIEEFISTPKTNHFNL